MVHQAGNKVVEGVWRIHSTIFLPCFELNFVMHADNCVVVMSVNSGMCVLHVCCLCFLHSSQTFTQYFVSFLERSSSTQRQALSDIVNCTPTRHTDTITSTTSSSQLLQGLSLPSATFSNQGVSTHSSSPKAKRRCTMIMDSDSDTD